MRSSYLLEPPSSPLPAGRAFLRQARFRLHDDYLVKITRAIAEVTDEQVWWRPNARQQQHRQSRPSPVR